MPMYFTLIPHLVGGGILNLNNMLTYSNEVLREIYFHSPNIVKNLLATIYGFIQRKERYGTFFKQYLKFLKEAQWWDNSKLIEFRDRETLNFIKYAIKFTEFYNNYEDITDVLEIKRLPIIDKQVLRNQYGKIIPKNLEKFKIRISHTSGTTGSALIFPLTVECFQREYAFRALHYSWSGVDLTQKPKIATFSGHPVAHPDDNKPPFWVYDYSNNWLLFSSYHLNAENLKVYVKKLVEFQPELIHGYPSSLYLVSLAFRKFGKRIKNLKGIYTASETLLDYQREIIEDAFQVKVFNWYGNSEMCANIVECEMGELHLKLEHSFVEILKDNNEEAKPGEEGRLVCTGFGNYAFPLIRYDIKDIVKLSPNQISKCGRGGILIEKIIGRIEDYVITPDGRYVGRLDHIFKDTVNVKEAQIIQMDKDEIIIKIVPLDSFSLKDETTIIKEARLRLGNNVRIKIEYVEKIERDKNGKFRFVINKLNEQMKL